MPRIDYDSAINVHICRNGVPGMSAACENQALAASSSFVIRRFLLREQNKQKSQSFFCNLVI